MIGRLDARRRNKHRKDPNLRKGQRTQAKRQGSRIAGRHALRQATRAIDPYYDPAAKRDDEDNAWNELETITDSQILASSRRLLRDFGTVRPDEFTPLFYAHGFWELELAVRDLLRIIDGRGRPRS